MAIPLLFLLEGKGWRLKVGLGFAWGVAAYGLLLWWLVPVSLAGYVVLVLALALQGALFAVLSLVERRSWVSDLFFLPCAWVVSEYLRNQLLGGFTWGLGVSQAMIPELVQAARFGGVYAVSWLLLFFSTGLFLLIRQKRSGVIRAPFFWLMITFPFIVGFIGSGVMMTEGLPAGQRLRVVLVQPNISRADKANVALYNENVGRHLILSKKAVQAARPDIVIWPETAFPDDILRDPLWRPRIEMVARNLNVGFVLGSALLSEDDHDLNALLLLDRRGQWRDIYYKRHLVPFSEYLPSDPFSVWLARTAGMGSYHFLPGDRRGLFALGDNKISAGLLICSEEGYPALARDLALRNAGFFISVLNDGWFQRPEALMMHGALAVFRAVETGRPLVRAANTGWSAGFDSRGRVLKAVALQSTGWTALDIPLASGSTFHTKFGDVFVWACLAFVIIISMISFLAKFRSLFAGFKKPALFILLIPFLCQASSAHAAAAVQRRVQQQKQMQAQAAQQYQQQMMQQQQAQQMAAYQQAQQVEAYKQAVAQRQYQEAVAQKAAEEYAIQKQAMEMAMAKKKAEEEQAAQVVQAVAQKQGMEAAQYQQAAAYRNAAELNAYKQAQEMKAYKEAQTQAQLNGEIRQYAEYAAKRNALMQAQAAQAVQETTERQLLAHAAYQNAAVQQKRAALNAAYQQEVRRRLGKEVESEVLASKAAGAAAAETPLPETIVGINELWQALERSSRSWAQIIDREVKLLTVSEFIDRFRKEGIRIGHSPGEYVSKIDALSSSSPEMLQSPFGNLLSYLAVMDYDFDNGQNKDALARKILGEANYLANKKRLGH
ncbi:MAG: apolipoprotein N-acyltransferase [Candidatus Omnitrophica bacterium]|nr:apolipoprotein N-acyltransferase [Candidatus Omnitrophota bacterium]